MKDDIEQTESVETFWLANCREVTPIPRIRYRCPVAHCAWVSDEIEQTHITEKKLKSELLQHLALEHTDMVEGFLTRS